MALLILNLVFGIALALFCHYVDGPVTKTLKEELKEKGVKWK